MNILSKYFVFNQVMGSLSTIANIYNKWFSGTTKYNALAQSSFITTITYKNLNMAGLNMERRLCTLFCAMFFCIFN